MNKIEYIHMWPQEHEIWITRFKLPNCHPTSKYRNVSLASRLRLKNVLQGCQFNSVLVDIGDGTGWMVWLPFRYYYKKEVR